MSVTHEIARNLVTLMHFHHRMPARYYVDTERWHRLTRESAISCPGLDQTLQSRMVMGVPVTPLIAVAPLLL
jgi:hypothetical protein